MKWTALVMLILAAGIVAAEVETVSSGVFRGSMRHIVTLDAETTVTGVSAGDYLSFRFPGDTYISKSDFEDLDVYIRRFDEQRRLMSFDVGPEKFIERRVGDEQNIDIDMDGKDDAYIAFAALDRKATFVIRSLDPARNFEPINTDANAVPEEVEPELIVEVDPVPSLEEQCEIDPAQEGCSVFKETNEQVINEKTPPSAPQAVPTPEPEEKGFFTRILEFFARIF